MKLSYTEDQLTREVQLLLTELYHITEAVFGESAGLRAMGLDEQSEFAKSLHPDALEDLADYPIWRDILWVHAYVREARVSADNQRPDLSRLARTIDHAFSPALIRGYEEEKQGNGEWIGNIPGPFEFGAGDVPFGFFYNGILSVLVALAQARAKMDNGERMTLGEIALLVGVPEQTVITNVHRKKFVTVEDGSRRYAEPVYALPWMQQYGYKPTTIEGAADVEIGVKTDSVTESELMFVPVAIDGSWFRPATQHTGRYVIGPKGAEVRYSDYFEALEALTQMKPKPHWRRKNANGIAGIVTGIRFDRMPRSTLERELVGMRPSL